MADPFIFRWNISRCVVGVTTPFLTYFSFYTPTTYVDHTAAACCGYIHIMNLLQENTHTHIQSAAPPSPQKKHNCIRSITATVNLQALFFLGGWTQVRFHQFAEASWPSRLYWSLQCGCLMMCCLPNTSKLWRNAVEAVSRWAIGIDGWCVATYG